MSAKYGKSSPMRTELLRFDGAVERDPAIEAWMQDMVVHWEQWRTWFECDGAVGTKLGNCCMMDVQLLVWEMCPSRYLLRM